MTRCGNGSNINQPETAFEGTNHCLLCMQTPPFPQRKSVFRGNINNLLFKTVISRYPHTCLLSEIHNPPHWAYLHLIFHRGCRSPLLLSLFRLPFSHYLSSSLFEHGPTLLVHYHHHYCTRPYLSLELTNPLHLPFCPNLRQPNATSRRDVACATVTRANNYDHLQRLQELKAIAQSHRLPR
jgi:hypothetical protein